MNLPALKICGISDPQTALFCADRGVGAIGVVFFPKSPRNVSASRAAEIFAPLPPEVARVGVFVNMPVDTLLQSAETAGLTTVQLHGCESNAEIERVLRAGYRVIKVVRSTGEKLVNEVEKLPQGSGVMVELSAGLLPGGTGKPWNWKTASILAGRDHFALAGGLNADNIEEAAAVSGATALDLSSAVESSPGIKDRARISAVISAAENLNLKTIFWR